jgi:predicted enzyme related to lactoylglutathione lyase
MAGRTDTANRRICHALSMHAAPARIFPTRAIPLALLLIGLAATAAPAGGTAAVELPPLITPPSTEHHVGKMIWADLLTPDLQAAEQFYGGLFGWTFRDVQAANGMDFTIAYNGGLPVAGMLRRDLPKDHSRQPAWLPFMAVRNVVEARQVALAQNGTLLAPPHSYPRRGEQAVLADPQGAVFAVLASSAGDPPDVLAAIGTWIWSSLITTDAERAAAFYQKLFGYQVYDLAGDASQATTSRGGDANIQHLVLASDDFARASANSIPADRPNTHPHWLSFIRVADATDAALRATSLGGQVLVAPHVDRHGGRIAVLSDPAGARFGVMEWTSTDPKEAPK